MRRVWLIPYGAGWSYDFNAQALARELGGRFEFRIAYKGTPASELRAWHPDLAIDFWWSGHVTRMLRDVPVLKQVSSHRWGQTRFGSLDVRALVDQKLRTCHGILVPSRRLLAVLGSAGAPHPALTPKGFDPAIFGDEGSRRGDLGIGWAGNARALDKRVDLLLTAAPELKVANRCFKHDEMRGFYNSIDVIACASDAEGDPLTLIEGMACGCFPIATDVGIVPELVRHGENGLIVEQTAEAFSEAFAWCRANLEFVREAGRRNAVEMSRTRTWSHAAQDWGDAFDAALARPRRIVR